MKDFISKRNTGNCVMIPHKNMATWLLLLCVSCCCCCCCTLGVPAIQETSRVFANKSMKVGWLNLHEHLPYKDVQRLVYSLLDVCDWQCIEIAHGARRQFTLQAVVSAARRGHMKLVRYMHMTRVVWDPDKIALATAQSGNEQLILWACNTQKCSMHWTTRQLIMLQVLKAGMFRCTLLLHKQCSFNVPDVAIYYCARHNNLEYVEKFAKMINVHPHPNAGWYSDVIDAILEYADVRFYRYATMVRHIAVKPEQEQRAREKWPELNKKRKV